MNEGDGALDMDPAMVGVVRSAQPVLIRQRELLVLIGPKSWNPHSLA